MAITSELRRAGPFAGNGTQTEFPFSFKIFESDQVSVMVSTDEGLSETELVSTAYTCTLNDDQDTTPGGLVTLVEPLAEGSILTILSAVPYLQPMVLTNRGGFYPEQLNTSADRAVILTQQLSEVLSRALKVPSTSEKTPEDVVEELMSAQEDARKAADEAAESARQAAESAELAKEYNDAAQVIKDHLTELDTVADNIDDVNTVADSINCVCKVAPYIEDVCEVAGITQEVVRVSQIQDEVREVSLVTDEIKIIAENLETEEIVSSDVDYGLITEQLDSADEDYGSITESATAADADFGNVMEAPDGGTTVIGGVVWEVGHNIEAVKDVAQAIEDGVLGDVLQAKGDIEKNVAAAQQAQQGAEAAKGDAEDAATLAKDWAIKMDAPVEGAVYSSKWHASQAKTSADRAEAAADDAATAADSGNFQMIEQLVELWNEYFDDNLDYRDYLSVAQSATLDAFYDFGRGYEGVTTV